MQVEEIMSARAIRVGPEEPVAVAARMLSRYNVGSLPVCGEDGKLLGMITDRDIVLRCVAGERDPERTPVRHIMTGKVVSIQAQASLEDAAAKMAREQVRRLPVEDRGKLCGIVSVGDLARAPGYATEAAQVLEQICSGISRR